MKIKLMIVGLLVNILSSFNLITTKPVVQKEEIVVESNSDNPKINDLISLENIVKEYKKNNDSEIDIRKEIMIYIRSEHYKSNSWNACAGSENIELSNYINKHSSELQSIREYESFNTPYTNEKNTISSSNSLH